ncbi:flagellar basal body rod protein FlgC [Lacrimispora sp. JR3]|uniref:flagellar basal body rod protein FlgC n=1 Tax=Lacrimispora sinapis TaxID=3111456 RepID=UPI0037490F9D
MSFLSSMNISASAMTAQRLRLDVASENIANIDTTRTEAGGPYRRKMVVLEARNENSFKRTLMNAAGRSLQQSTGGVRVSQIMDDTSPLKSVYNPEHPDADEDGYVQMPNVDLIKETVDSMSATRSYEANITAFNAIKMMASKALEIGK